MDLQNLQNTNLQEKVSTFPLVSLKSSLKNLQISIRITFGSKLALASASPFL